MNAGTPRTLWVAVLAALALAAASPARAGNPNFDNPTGAINSANFGLITNTAGAPGGSLLLPSIGDPRILQFALKLHF